MLFAGTWKMPEPGSQVAWTLSSLLQNHKASKVQMARAIF